MCELNNLQQQVEKEKAMMIYFFNDDCAPCISLRPKIENLMINFPKMMTSWVNSKKHPEITAAYGVYSNPTMLLFFEGKEFKRFGMYVSTEEIKAAIFRIYSILFDTGEIF
jgi:thioredoxin 1